MLKTAWKLISSGSLWADIQVSLIRVARGYLVGAALGIVLGTLMGLYKPIYNILNSVVSLLRPIPMMALIPLFILWLGIGETCKTALIALGTFWSVLLNTIHGIQSVDPKLLEVATVLEKNKSVIFRQVYLPAALPAIITGLRLGMGVAWSCVVAAEMMAASKGLGYMLMFSREMSRPDKLMVGVFTIGLIGLLIDKGLLYVQNKILWWDSKK
jgi:sulfonate transport system permease protein